MNYKLQRMLSWIAVDIAFLGVCIDGYVADWIPRLVRCIGIIMYIIVALCGMTVDSYPRIRSRSTLLDSSIIEEDEDEQRETD